MPQERSLEVQELALTLPRIISVDDHVLEPPELWTSRLPARYQDRGPRVVRERGHFSGNPGGRRTSAAKVTPASSSSDWIPAPEGDLADVWYYDDVVKPLGKLFAGASFDQKSLDWGVVTYDDVRPGTWKQKERLADMDLNHTDVSICFPNTLPRFCGQTFLEQKDKELALLCVKAYNDWMIDEWCAGDARGRLIPLTIVPLWDVDLAVEEVRRCADKGSHAITFVELPEALGLPTLYSKEWDPLYSACQDTQTTICMHIGSSSQMAITSSDAPHVAASALTYQFGMHSLIDYIYSGVLERFPRLTIAYSEANVGWMPYVIERMDMNFHKRGQDTDYGWTGLSRPPSTYLSQVYGCILDDKVGIANHARIGTGNICFETDYPHADSEFPKSNEAAAELVLAGNLDEEQTYQFLRGNAIEAFGLSRFGVEK